MFSKTRCALMFGVLMSAFHLCWLVLVVTGVAKPLYDWILAMHFINLPFSMLTFNYLHALILLVMTFVVGYVFGYIFAAMLNWAKKK